MLPVMRRTAWMTPARPLHRLESFFDRVVEDVDRAVTKGVMPVVTWGGVPVSIWEDDGHLHIEAELPGFTRDQIDLTVHEGVLTIRGERKPVEGRAYLHDGRAYGNFERVITLPETVNPDAITAGLANGVLTVTFDKTPKAQPRKISIQNG